jgi:hypothetical protein
LICLHNFAVLQFGISAAIPGTSSMMTELIFYKFLILLALAATVYPAHSVIAQTTLI